MGRGEETRGRKNEGTMGRRREEEKMREEVRRGKVKSQK